jgi:uncharacterized OB-fold protein
MDTWTQPFWIAAATHQLQLPHCDACGRHRWPPSAFCPACHSQMLAWADAGNGVIYSFTIVRGKPNQDGALPPVLVPALIEFPQAPGVRLPAAIVDSVIADIRIGAAVTAVWEQARNATVPMFCLA